VRAGAPSPILRAWLTGWRKRREDDVTGLNRPQFLDRNWYVCGQGRTPGTQLTGQLEDVVDLAVAEIGASC
jgi:hypothetical protein